MVIKPAATRIIPALAFALALAFRGTPAGAQISPGELSSPHSHLDGLDKCTSCHTLGRTLSNEKCLRCHTEIRARLTRQTGYHRTVKSRQCIECHKEHHGRDFPLIHFDTKTFDHSAVGYILLGRHRAQGCPACHAAEKIRAADILSKSARAKAKTFLGLSTDCIACHSDMHKGQFPPKCEHCHNNDGWKPAPGFSHSKTRFKLTGKHALVECGKCHKSTAGDGGTARYTRMDFASCASCHADPHTGRFKQQCRTCHTTGGWKEGSAKGFDHSLTQFVLAGKHQMVKCEQCHADTAQTHSAGTQKKGKKKAGFRVTNFKKCTDCHADAHAGQFAGRKDHGPCESCHNESGFTPSTFSIAGHQGSRFPLTGAHLATPCNKCHQPGKVQAKNTQLFHWTGTLTCQTCHVDAHKGQFKTMMTDGCETCHSTVSWDSLSFSHDRTRFSLRGRHSAIACRDCHKIVDTGEVSERVQYTGLPLVCNGCHADVHAGQFSEAGKTDCARCHELAGWKSLVFQHNTQSRFMLTGKHAGVECRKCHLPENIEGKTVIRYKPIETKCVFCHPAQQ